MTEPRTYSAVVVEDEPVILRNVISKIESIDASVKVIGYSYNGRDALEIIKTKKPDFLFTDIRMPIMDGLELVKAVKPLFPELPIIIISGYDDFQYAQQAMKWGIRDYLPKPLNTMELSNILAQLRTEQDSKIELLQTQALQLTINGEQADPEIEVSSLFSTDQFYAVLMQVGHLSQYSSTSSPAMKIDYNAMMQTVFQSTENWWTVQSDHATLLLLPADAEQPLTIAEKIQGYISRIVSPTPVTICMESAACRFRDLHPLSIRLKRLLDNRLVMGRSSVFVSNHFESISLPPAHIDGSFQHKVAQLIQSKKKESLKQELIALFDLWNKSSFPQKWIEKTLRHLIHVIHQHSISVSEAEVSHAEYEIFGKLSRSNDFRSLGSEIWEIIDGLLSNHETIDMDNSKELASQIEHYIKENFAKQISIKEITSKFNFHDSYINKVFKKHTGTTPVKYLIELRIQEAQRLITSNADLSMKDVGNLVGYPDSQYFSRIFKNITGISPSEHAKSTIG